ncbi:MAG: DUF3298 and DUF4163 domain-containing protein [Chitinophagales bacterium]|nr:DUF3298 and DUF4163 domain-containing protein [Chitinophagales bacterium]MCZ2393115.1 DUF3298 and DUF4163 domain-containing protein [Chitinophagales bacterium]
MKSHTPTLVIVVIIFSLFSSCKRDHLSKQLIEANSIQSEIKHFDIADDRYQKDPVLQSHFKLQYPEITEVLSKEALENINASIAGFILDSETPVKEFPNIQQQAQKMFHEYDEAYAEFPRSSTWLVDKNIAIAGKVGTILTISFTESSYKGGAHPNSYTIFKSFDLNDGHIIKMYDIIDSTKMDILNKIRYKVLENQKITLLADSLWKTYMFEDAFKENGDFYTNQNINFTKDTIEFFYNSYEIAPYAFGATSLKIPIKSMMNVLKKSSPYYQYFNVK